MTTPHRCAIYPGTFDPVTNGHIDIIERAMRLYDSLIVGVSAHSRKSTTFSLEKRVALMRDVCAPYANVQVETFDGLLVHWAQEKQAQWIIRGLRALSDFEYEFQMALANRKLYGNIETVFLMTREDCACISSSLVKEIALLGGPVEHLVPPSVHQALREISHA